MKLKQGNGKSSVNFDLYSDPEVGHTGHISEMRSFGPDSSTTHLGNYTFNLINN